MYVLHVRFQKRTAIARVVGPKSRRKSIAAVYVRSSVRPAKKNQQSIIGFFLFTGQPFRIIICNNIVHRFLVVSRLGRSVGSFALRTHVR